ncbi:hypothetical protein [Clavibacter zhangzhiyongii]|uniref:DUF7882 family protein n=1 Tax=Clavibacter zhangzhiyongii TaxID=2768071 RepID=UPI0039E1C88D
MGTFKYDSTLTAEFDDRLLAHLQLVIGAKLRRGEAFYFSWRDDVEVGDGRTTIWMHNSLPLVFKYHGSRVPPINRKWVDALMTTANSPGGLLIMREPPRTSRATTRADPPALIGPADPMRPRPAYGVSPPGVNPLPAHWGGNRACAWHLWSPGHARASPGRGTRCTTPGADDMGDLVQSSASESLPACAREHVRSATEQARFISGYFGWSISGDAIRGTGDAVALYVEDLAAALTELGWISDGGHPLGPHAVRRGRGRRGPPHGAAHPRLGRLTPSPCIRRERSQPPGHFPTCGPHC